MKTRILLCLALFGSPLDLWSQTEAPEQVARWLETFVYPWSNQPFDAAILETASVQDLKAPLKALGLSSYSLFRNEIFARRGYVFKSEVLNALFSRTRWYRPDPNFTFDRLTRQETKNVESIQALETEFDSEVVADWIRRHPDLTTRLVDGGDFDTAGLDSEVRFSLNHFKWLPAEVLRQWLGASYGFLVPDARLRSIFTRLNLEAGSLTWNQAVEKFSNEARANVEYLQMRELYEKKDSIIFSLPTGITGFPAIGSDLYLVKTFGAGAAEVHFGGLSFAQLPETLPRDNHRTSIETLLPLSGPGSDFATQAARQKLKAFALGSSSTSAIEMLQIFFQNKRYRGYVDAMTFNPTDFDPPAELKPALATLGMDYLQLLRREIHARNGMTMGDPVTLRIFAACSWYQPRYTPTLSTDNRFPPGVKLSRAEAINFSLLEGEIVYRSYLGFLSSLPSSSAAGYLLVDLNQARVRQVDFGWIEGGGKDALQVGAFREPGSQPIDFNALSNEIQERSGVEIYVTYSGAC